MADESTTAAIVSALLGAPNALVNGAKAFGAQSKWILGGYPANTPMPAYYDGGPDYPAKNDANGYVRQNWPSEDGLHGLVGTRPDTFYTPEGLSIPPSGRGPYLGELLGGAPMARQLAPLMENLRQKGPS